MTAPFPFALPFGGRLEGRLHHLPVRIYYEDTDAAGIVYHASYLRFTERGRSEMMRAIGIELSQLRDETGVVFVLHSADVKFKRAARLGDLLTVETALTELGAASLAVRQTVMAQAEGADKTARKPVAEFNGLLACTGRDGKPARMPAAVRDKIKAFVG